MLSNTQNNRNVIMQIYLNGELTDTPSQN
ncbi:thiamine biosynthesis protein ThiS, partial [Acinetobacter baumannii]